MNNNVKEEPVTDDHLIELMRKIIHLDKSKVLYEKKEFAESDLDDLSIHHSEWWVDDGWLSGKNPGNHPGMAILKNEATIGVDWAARRFFDEKAR